MHEPPMPAITLEQVDAALAKFPKGTAMGIDHWHLPVCMQFPEHLRRELAGLLNMFEILCAVPRHIFPWRMGLLGKPKGGFRTIASLSNGQCLSFVGRCAGWGGPRGRR